MSFGTDLDAIKAFRATAEPYTATEHKPLDNAIHDLWQQRNFRSENKAQGAHEYENPQGAMADTVYKRMMPALRLATLLHAMSTEYFRKIYRANVVNNTLDGNFKSDENDKAAYKTMLESLSNKMRIYMEIRNDPTGRCPHGRCGLGPDYRPVYLELNSDYRDWYSRVDYDVLDIQRQNTIACSLAVTLVHEHAHAVWRMRDWPRWWAEWQRNYKLVGGGTNNDPEGDAVKEALLLSHHGEPAESSSDSEVELGKSWESYMFGGLFPHFNHVQGLLSIQAMTGTCWRRWDTMNEAVIPNWWVIAVRTYNQFFNKDAWRDEEERQKHCRDGGRCLVSGDEFKGKVAVYLTPLRLINPSPVDGLEYMEDFKRRLDLCARGRDLNTA